MKLDTSILNNKFPLLLLSLSLLLVLVYSGFYKHNPQTLFFANDQATDFMIARHAENGSPPLLGPPSHTGGRHLGPVYYAYVAAVYKLASADIYRASVYFMISKLFTVIFYILLLYFICKKNSPGLAIFGLFVALFSFPTLETIRVQWHSNYLFIASLIGTASAVAVILKGPRLLPFFVIGQTILLQSHLSATPVVLGLCLAVMIYILLPSNRTDLKTALSSKLLWLAFIITFFLCIPSILFEIKYPSNIGSLFSVHTSKESIKAGIIEALRTSATFLFSYTSSLKGSSLKEPLNFIPAVLFSLAFLYLLFSADKKLRWIVAVLCSPLLITLTMLSLFKAPLYVHYLRSSISVPHLLLALTFWHTALMLKSKSVKPFFLKAVLCLFVFFIPAALPYKIKTALDLYDNPKVYNFHSMLHVKKLIEFIKKDSGQEKPLVYARLASKPVRNAYYYLLNTGHAEIDYRGFFPEIPEFDSFPALKEFNKAYVVLCPTPYRVTEREILSAFTRRWRVEEQLNTESEPVISDCSIIRLRKKRAA